MARTPKTPSPNTLSPKAQPSKSEDTRSRILDAALKLFNQMGSAGVTTNHIAETLGMSPGNLYYHYANKAEIVRALFARIMGEWAANYAIPEGSMPTIAMMEAMVAGNFDIQWRYRFFFRDLTMLLRADPELAAAYRANRKSGHDNTLLLIGLFVEAGIVSGPTDTDELHDLAQLLWLVGDFWLVFRDAAGVRITQSEKNQGVRMFRRLLTPYLKGA